MERRICYISRNYKSLHCAGGIARTTIEKVLSDMGAVNLGLPQGRSRNGIVHGVRGFASMMLGLSRLRRGDVLVVQYPVKGYLPLIRKVAAAKGVKTVALLIDLDSFREKTLTPEQEIPILNSFDAILTHNVSMRRWLASHGCTSLMVDYEIMDYLYGNSEERHAPADGKYSLYYVGNLTRRNNDYLYKLARLMPDTDIYLYGPDYDREEVAKLPNIHTMGFVQDIDIIERHSGDFGISWYGSSLDSAEGKLGEYMNVNNPYKVGLYFRANSPVIAWRKAGRAELIEREGLGITVDSLEELPAILSALSREEYEKMLARVKVVGERLASGHYLREAMARVLEKIGE